MHSCWSSSDRFLEIPIKPCKSLRSSLILTNLSRTTLRTVSSFLWVILSYIRFTFCQAFFDETFKHLLTNLVTLKDVIVAVTCPAVFHNV